MTMIVALEMEALSSFATHLSSSSSSLSTFSPKINHSHRLSRFLSFSRSKRQQWAAKEVEAAELTKREATAKPGPSFFFLLWAIWDVRINCIKQGRIFQKSTVKYCMCVTFHIFTNILSKLHIFDNFLLLNGPSFGYYIHVRFYRKIFSKIPIYIYILFTIDISIFVFDLFCIPKTNKYI